MGAPLDLVQPLVHSLELSFYRGFPRVIRLGLKLWSLFYSLSLSPDCAHLTESALEQPPGVPTASFVSVQAMARDSPICLYFNPKLFDEMPSSTPEEAQKHLPE
ncbi:hypothetical protein OPV22_026381 [Ensete ventricosum]|uniref:Uncharacterized protein n=1 Tax=Ensete ventricosum TaxID=4639 RepID=A0AAV8QGF3_ENSVE|nr:hypothetical protein OPV22_026381 [Ensete ventricosum]